MKPANPVLAHSTSCSACFLQDSSIRHIDFDSALDRGYVYAEASGTPIQMDDLILCENCIKQAAKLVGFVEEGSKDAKIRELESERESLTRERDSAQNYSDQLEGAFDARPQPVKIDGRKKPRNRKTRSGDDE